MTHPIPLPLITAEDQCILACARTTVDATVTARVKELMHTPLDWSRLITRAHEHRVLLLLNYALRQIGFDGIPRPAAALLKQQALEVWHWNMSLTGELFRMLRLFERAGIAAMPYKGPVLAMQAYGDLSLRPFGDLDVLIHREDMWRAREVLMRQGYRPLPEPPGFKLTDAHTRAYHEYSLMSPDDSVRFELQWGVMQEPFAFPANMEQWWDQAETIRLAGQTVLRLPIEKQLLILCVHGAKHLWERLIWICDIAELVRRNPQIDWAALIAEARSLGVERMLLLGISLAHTLLDMPLPHQLAQRLRTNTAIAALTSRAYQFIFYEGNLQEELLPKRNAFLIQALDRWNDRAAVCLRYANRILQPFEMYKKYGLSPLKRLMGR